MRIRTVITLIAFLGYLGLGASNLNSVKAQDTKGRVVADVIVLSETSKLGKVTFNHLNHSTKNFNIDGTATVACVQCHHVEQPAIEAAKAPPLKTAFPADRTVTLTADALKDPKTPSVTSCRSCHIPKDAKPTLLTEIPQIKNEKSGEPMILTNQLAFHRKCATCHDQVVKARPTVQAPTAMKCAGCHKKAA